MEAYQSFGAGDTADEVRWEMRHGRVVAEATPDFFHASLGKAQTTRRRSTILEEGRPPPESGPWLWFGWISR